MSWGAMLAPVAGALMGQFMGEGQRRNQVQQQRELNAVNEESAKNMGKFNYEQQMRMLKETGPEFQVKQLKDAGMSVGNMYGGSGAGGAIQATPSSMSASSAEGQSAQTGAVSQMGMLAAQTALLGAQKENVEADTKLKTVDAVKKAGIDTDVAGETLTGMKFQNEVNKLLGTEEMSEAVRNANMKLEAESGKAWNEYQAWKAAGFGKLENNDPNSPVAKAIKAGFDQAVVELANAKKEGNLKDAETTVKQFEAKMANEGLAPGTPWYVKFGADLLERAGLNPLKK